MDSRLLASMPSFLSRGFPREMWVIFSGDVVTSLGMSMVFIFLSVYFNIQLGISMTILGTIWMVTDISSFFSQLLGGALADHFGRKRLMELSLILRGIIWIGMAFVSNTTLIASLVVLTGIIASLFWPAASAMVTDIIPEEQRVEAFGLWRIGGNLGWGLGAMIGGILASISFKLVFIVGGISNLIFAIFVILLLKETLPAKENKRYAEEKTKSVFSTVLEYKTVLANRRFVFFTCVGILIAFMYSQSSTTMPVYAVKNTIINTSQLGYIWALNAWAVVALQMFVANYVEKFSLTKMLAVGSL
ncbi:MAG: MFS transporter, partial [Candidatus Methanofastidiosia archaeon]